MLDHRGIDDTGRERCPSRRRPSVPLLGVITSCSAEHVTECGCLARGAPDPFGRRRSRRRFSVLHDRRPATRALCCSDGETSVSSRACPHSPWLAPRGPRRTRWRDRERSPERTAPVVTLSK